MHRSMHTELPICTGLESYVTFKILFVLEALACGITSLSACRGMSRFSRSSLSPVRGGQKNYIRASQGFV